MKVFNIKIGKHDLYIYNEEDNYRYDFLKGKEKIICSGNKTLEEINKILEEDFKVPFKVTEDKELCLLMKSKDKHTNKKVFGKCKYIMTKDGMKVCETRIKNN